MVQVEYGRTEEKDIKKATGQKQGGGTNSVRVTGGHKIPENEARVQRKRFTKPSGG